MIRYCYQTITPIQDVIERSIEKMKVIPIFQYHKFIIIQIKLFNLIIHYHSIVVLFLQFHYILISSYNLSQ